MNKKLVLWQLYAYKFDNSEEMDQFFKKYEPPQFTQYEIGHLNSFITIEKIDS